MRFKQHRLSMTLSVRRHFYISEQPPVLSSDAVYVDGKLTAPQHVTASKQGADSDTSKGAGAVQGADLVDIFKERFSFHLKKLKGCNFIRL